MKIWNMMLEPIETRYTKDWVTQFPEVFKINRVNFETIEGESIKSNVGSKFFLDPINTNIWKLTQMTKLLKRFNEVNDGDVIFFQDLWFPSLEMIPYIKHLTGKKVKICGILHAGTYDPWDLTNQTGMTRWASKLEESWFEVVDKIFVATQFHKDLITKNRMVDKRKIIVTGLPIDIKKLQSNYSSDKKRGIIFTGRKSIEKGINIVYNLSKRGLHINIAMDKNYSRDEYFTELGKSDIVFSPSEQETFGYGVAEAMALGCIPIVPNKLSFVEYVPKKYRYNNEDEIVKMMTKFKPDKKISNYIQKYDSKLVISKMIKEMQRC